jgi:rubrerythrin
MEETYWTECEVCDSVTEVVVEDDNTPQFCPMCGEDSVFELIED